MGQIVGAYPIYNPVADPTPIVAALAASPLVDGLEVPVTDGRIAAPPGARDGWEYVATLIPATMGRLATQPTFGLASPDPDGRRAALDLARTAHRATLDSPVPVRAIEFQSAPTRLADPAAFADSLTEIAGWDWGSTRVLVEHQDAWTDAHPVQKGFLPLTAELDAAAAVGAGIVINWARSVIEARDPSAGLAQIRAAAARGLLAGVIFSSACDRENDLGPAWADLHAAPAGTTSAPAGSLLGAAEIRDCLVAARDAWHGFKINLPPAADTGTRIAALLETAALVAG